jgi:hypothetical protein
MKKASEVELPFSGEALALGCQLKVSRERVGE